MSLLSQPANGVGKLPMLKAAASGFMSSGHKAVASDFLFTISENSVPDLAGLTMLIQSTQIPEVRRKLVETKGPFGVGVPQQGGAKKDGEMSITFAETVNSQVYRALRTLSDNKVYFAATLMLACEENPGATKDTTYEFSAAWIELDPSDLSVEDDTATIKPSGTLHYAWFE